MNTPKRGMNVVRTYKHEPDDCARALALLLEKSASQRAAHPAAPNDAKERSNELRAKTIIPERA